MQNWCGGVWWSAAHYVLNSQLKFIYKALYKAAYIDQSAVQKREWIKMNKEIDDISIKY